MADYPQNNIHNRHIVSSGDLARFLEIFSPDVEEACRCYTRLHEKLVGFFNMKGISDPVSAADETLDRAIIKINAGTPVPDVGKYCLGIARNVAREYLRRTQRESSAFLNFIKDLNDNSSEEVERISGILKPCFEQLALEERKLLLAYCHVMRGGERAEHRRQLAEIMKTTVLALRMRVTRLRTILTDCVRKRSNG
jgi:DNA-directed RNA polymerase specialized sigma24 family protein